MPYFIISYYVILYCFILYYIILYYVIDRDEASDRELLGGHGHSESAQSAKS